MSGVDAMVFHSGLDGDTDAESAEGLVRRFQSRSSITLDEIVDELVEMEFEWGESDGN